jgi:multidrug efflux system outer membrane protein
MRKVDVQAADIGQGKSSASQGRYWVLGLILVSLGLSGCLVGPDYKKPSLTLPTQWANGKNVTQAKAPELSRWWTGLKDALLNDLIEEAVTGNLDVATAKAKIREARASYRQTVGELFPTITNSETVTQAKTPTAALGPVASAGGSGGSNPILSGRTYTRFQVGFDASWELDLFGANRRAMEAARYGVDAEQESLRATLLTLIGDVASSYAEARGYQARIALALTNAESQDETAKLTQAKFESGSASAVDAANALGQAASTRATIPTLEASYAASVHSLSLLTGRPPAALTERLAQVRPIPVPTLPIASGIPADVLLSRPDVRMAERQYAQYTAKIGQAEAARYPSLSLTGSVSTSATNLGDLGKTSSIGWSYGPSLSIPIFNAGKLKAAVEVAEAQRDQYFIAYRAAVLTALQDVENALVSLEQERRRNEPLAASAESYRQAVSLSRTLYQSGSSSFLDVLTAERSQYSAEDALIQSRVLLTTYYISLNKALGGGWDGEIDISKDTSAQARQVEPAGSEKAP